MLEEATYILIKLDLPYYGVIHLVTMDFSHFRVVPLSTPAWKCNACLPSSWPLPIINGQHFDMIRNRNGQAALNSSSPGKFSLFFPFPPPPRNLCNQIICVLCLEN